MQQTHFFRRQEKDFLGRWRSKWVWRWRRWEQRWWKESQERSQLTVISNSEMPFFYFSFSHPSFMVVPPEFFRSKFWFPSKVGFPKTNHSSRKFDRGWSCIHENSPSDIFQIFKQVFPNFEISTTKYFYLSTLELICSGKKDKEKEKEKKKKEKEASKSKKDKKADKNDENDSDGKLNWISASMAGKCILFLHPRFELSYRR